MCRLGPGFKPYWSRLFMFGPRPVSTQNHLKPTENYQGLSPSSLKKPKQNVTQFFYSQAREIKEEQPSAWPNNTMVHVSFYRNCKSLSIYTFVNSKLIVSMFFLQISKPNPNFVYDLDGKTFKKPRRPYEKERLDAELKLVGEYGLRCKRELWRVQYALSRIRNNARNLLTLDEKNPRRIFEGEALLRRMFRYGLLDETQNKLDYVLALTVENFLERRLQTLVFKSGMAKSIHHARVLIRQRHIRFNP